MKVQTIISLIFFLLLGSCSENQRNTDALLSRADSLMETSPDSALSIMESIPQNDIKNNPQKARYALLRSMALDKNYIDTTTFEILQPAIDYFLSENKGTADEKLRTLYYKGRIHQDRKEERDALACYVAATDSTVSVSPTPTLARAYTAKSTIYYNQHFYDRYVRAALEGAEIYRRLGRKSLYADNLTRAMDGAIILEDKVLADSLYNIIKTLPEDYEGAKSQIAHVKIIYASTFLSPAEAERTLSEIDRDDIPDGELLDMASAYASIGDAKNAEECFKGVRPENLEKILKYLFVESSVAEVNGDYKKAMESMNKGLNISDSLVNQRYRSDILYLEDKYKDEQKIEMEKAQKKTVILWAALTGSLLVAVIFIILFFLKRSKMKRVERENEMYRALQQVEKERDDLERKFLEEVRSLVAEKKEVTRLLNEKNEISEDLKRLLRERVGMINGLIDSHISNNHNFRKEIDDLTDMAVKDKKKFMATSFKVFEKIYPGFVDLLNRKGLSEEEKGYICLYLMGLKGKEIGYYLNTSQHYKISSSIRSKLGLNANDMNLSRFIEENRDR